MKPFYTTGEVAKLTGLSQKTVKNYCDQGRILSENAPITNYRRISYDNLHAFMVLHDIPLAPLLGEASIKILVAEDEVAVRQVMVRSLEQLKGDYYKKVTIETAEDGYEACFKMALFKPDFLLLDLNMPRTDGIAVLRHLRKTPTLASIRVVVCTGYATPENLAVLETMHVSEILVKPVPVELLIQTVQRVMQSEGQKIEVAG